MKANPRRGHRRRSRPVVYTVTDAPRPLSDDIAGRQRRYLWSMGVRTVCFLGAAALAVLGAPFPLVLACVVGALILPYIAVVVANAGREPVSHVRLGDERDGRRGGRSGRPPEIGS